MTLLLISSSTAILFSTLLYLFYFQRKYSHVQQDAPLQVNNPIVTTRFLPYPSYLTIPLPQDIFKSQCKEKYALKLSRLSPYPLHVHARQVHAHPLTSPLPTSFSVDQDMEMLFIDCTDESLSFVQVWVTLSGYPTYPLTNYKHESDQEGGSPIATMYGMEQVQIGVRLDHLLFGLIPQASLALVLVVLVVVSLYFAFGVPLQSHILQSYLSSHHQD